MTTSESSGAGGARKLTQQTLATFAPRVSVPTYDRARLNPAIVHIGVGGFHRAHLAFYLDEIAERRISTAWGERGVGLLPGDQRMADALIPQDGLYTLVVRDAHQDAARIIGVIREYLFAPPDPERVLRALADEATRIVSLTVTEGGYNFNQTTGEFEAANPAIQHDLAHPSTPSTFFGYLCEALDRRRRAGYQPFTVLSCDNLQGNGDTARTMLLSFASLRDESLRAWIESNVAFPNGMVDRITPQTTAEDRQMVAATFGIDDAWPVMTEPFIQWVLEDQFSNGRPPLQEVGVQMVSDVHPYEMMKMRLLNASHQALGYLGYLSGYRYVHDVMADPLYREYIERLMDEEVTPLLPRVPGVDLDAYKRTLLERFANPKIRDTVLRLCTDGSARMPKFLLPSLSEALAQGRPHRLLTLAVAGWFRFLRGVDEAGEAIPISDQMASELQARALEGQDDPRPLLGIHSLFGDLARNAALVSELTEALHAVSARGARTALSTYLAPAGR